MEKEIDNPLNNFLEETEAEQEKILKSFLKARYEDHLSAINYFLKEKNKRFTAKIELEKTSPKENPPKHRDEVEEKYRNLVTRDFTPFYDQDKITLAEKSPFLNN